MAFFFSFLVFAFPILVICNVKRDWNPVRQKWRNEHVVKQRYGAFFEGLSLDNGPYVLIYPFYFMLRRLLLALIVVIFRKFLWMQIFLKTYSIIAAVIMLGEANYFETNFKLRMEYANEILVMLMAYNMICFSPFVPEIQTRTKMGYFCCVVESLALAANIWLIMSSSVKGAIFKARVYFSKKAMTKERGLHLKERAKGRLLRKLRHQERQKIPWDYGYEDDRVFDKHGKEIVEVEEEDQIETEAPKLKFNLQSGHK